MRRFARSLLAVALCSVVLALTPIRASAAATFAATGSMATARAQHTATLLLPGGRVLVAGGGVSDPAGGVSETESAELYDPATGLFVATGSMTIARRLHTATLLSDGKVLLAGGVSPPGVSVASAELYDPTTGAFTATGSMVAARFDHTATLLLDGTVLIVGGNAPDGTTASAELYDPGTGTFTATGPTIIARDGHTATRLTNGKVLIAGGSGFNPVNTEMYDPAKGGFRDAGAMHKNRNFHTATLLLPSGKVLVAGGLSPGHPTSLEASAEVYDPATDAFTAVGPMNVAREEHAATLLPDGKVLVTGGNTVEFGEQVAAGSAELYDPDTNTFALTALMTARRLDHTATMLLQSGQVLVAGGADGLGNTTSSAELFYPTGPPTCSFAITPTSQTFGPGGGGDRVNVTTDYGCTWTAVSNDTGVVTVVAVMPGASNGGPGSVGYSVSANSGPARSASLTIAGQTFTVNQDSGCTFSIAPSSASFPAGGGADSVTVSTTAGCAWSATSNDPSVVTISTGASGAGGGLVQYRVAANNGPVRKATLTIAGQTFTVNQSSGCTLAFVPTSAHLAPAGGSGSFTVNTVAGCDWTAASQDPSWLTVTSGASGSGPGTVGYSVAANSGPARSSSIRIGGQNFAVTQDGITALNTPTGVNVGVSLLGGGVRILFANVVTPGVTTVILTNPCQASDSCRLPSGYVRFGNLGFDIQTTAVTTGPITLAFDLRRLVPPDPITPPNPIIPPNPIAPQLVATLRVLHGEGGALVDRTIATPPDPVILPDPVTPPDPIRTIYASVASLSPFVIAQLGPEPLLQKAHDRLVALRQGTNDPRKSRALDVAIGALDKALAPAHWVDPFHVTPTGAVATAIDTALAVANLAAYRGDPAVHLVIDQILGADLELVLTAVSRASGP
jgi:hypothetical protein